jgi:hypothetical protein
MDGLELCRAALYRRVNASIETLRDLEDVLVSRDLVAEIAAEDAVYEAGVALTEPAIRICNGVRG